ncbi:hypothetical protein NDU88_007140 [Pleurodeles waltl]|uniref:Uncharacterized protein n=1 Tax=Pleurodeles waltl TaxID=8319 RepID=A0AAV7MF93_PLEWA|nr:hypothetical protein NDU88_007140 [Pleurodeles waltl]
MIRGDDGSSECTSTLEEDEEEIQLLLQAMQKSLRSIDQKMDTPNARMDSISYTIDQQDGRLGEAEQRISPAEDSLNSKGDTLHNMEKVLHVIAAKNEELKARSQRKIFVSLAARIGQHVQNGMNTDNDVWSRCLLTPASSREGKTPSWAPS